MKEKELKLSGKMVSIPLREMERCGAIASLEQWKCHPCILELDHDDIKHRDILGNEWEDE